MRLKEDTTVAPNNGLIHHSGKTFMLVFRNEIVRFERNDVEKKYEQKGYGESTEELR